jgi:hypothetical protein
MINRTKRTLDQLGPMRPGLIGRQYRNPQERKTLNYTHQMEIRTEYLRTGNLKAVRVEVPNFERFHKLVDQWADQAQKFSQLNARHSSEP